MAEKKLSFGSIYKKQSIILLIVSFLLLYVSSFVLNMFVDGVINDHVDMGRLAVLSVVSFFTNIFSFPILVIMNIGVRYIVNMLHTSFRNKMSALLTLCCICFLSLLFGFLAEYKVSDSYHALLGATKFSAEMAIIYVIPVVVLNFAKKPLEIEVKV